MQKKAKAKDVLTAVLVTLTAEGGLLLLLGWGGVKGWIEAERLLSSTVAAVGISSVLGTLYLRRQKWSVFISSLIAGVLTQLIAMLTGYFAFGRAGFDGGRWWLPAAGFSAALLSGLLLAKPASGKRKRKTKRRIK